MRNVIKTIAAMGFALFLAGQAFATSPTPTPQPLRATIEEPKSPTGINNLNINVVTLDTDPVPVTVQCYDKTPWAGGFSTLGSPITVTPNGGNNTANCQTAGLLTGDGTYQFYAVVTDGSNTFTTNTVSVDYETTPPGTPTNYAKSVSGACTFLIAFTTANDSGKTNKVNLYRSDSTNFTLDGSTFVASNAIGSNTNGSFTNTPPDCSKTYYYELRAFDSLGNGSGVVGDNITVFSGTTGVSGATGPSSGAAGAAIPAGTAGNVLGEATGPTGGATGPSSVITGSPTVQATGTPTQTPQAAHWYSSPKIYIIAGAGLLLVVVAIFAL